MFESKVSPSSEKFQENKKNMLALIDRLKKLNARAKKLSAKKANKFKERGQLLPRDRLSLLLDPGYPYMEIGNLAGYLLDNKDEEKSIPGGTIMAGVGYVSGTRCVIVTDDSGIKAGALTVAGGYRLRRAQEIALQQKLPFIHLVESAGGDLINYKVEDFVEGGVLFANLAKLSKAGIPVLSVLHGSSTAGGAYMPGLSDYVVAVKGGGKAFLAGPPLLKAATGEIATEEDLGGAQMHASVSGLAEYLASSDAEAIGIMRDIVRNLDWNRHATLDLRSYCCPKYDSDEIIGIVPTDYRVPYDVRELILRLVDDSYFTDFKPAYGISTVCVQAFIHGMPCGIIGNNGPIDPDGATKAAQFIQLMDQAKTAVIFLQNTTGYMVGTEYEKQGMIKHGSKMIQAVTNASVPRLTLMVGASFGAGNYGMCGRAYAPDFLYSWPNTATGVMGGEQAALVMKIVAQEQARKAGVAFDEVAANQQLSFLTQLFDDQSDGFYTSGHLLDDGMIDPRDSRELLGMQLAIVEECQHREVNPNSFGVARM